MGYQSNSFYGEHRTLQHVRACVPRHVRPFHPARSVFCVLRSTKRFCQPPSTRVCVVCWCHVFYWVASPDAANASPSIGSSRFAKPNPINTIAPMIVTVRTEICCATSRPVEASRFTACSQNAEVKRVLKHYESRGLRTVVRLRYIVERRD